MNNLLLKAFLETKLTVPRIDEYVANTNLFRIASLYIQVDSRTYTCLLEEYKFLHLNMDCLNIDGNLEMYARVIII